MDNQAIELDPEYTYAFNNRGLAYAKLKQFEKAIQDYDQAIELNPKDFNATVVKNIEILWV
jgi:regulator of sirC expression with transglutaminase-like and TPR domain